MYVKMFRVEDAITCMRQSLYIFIMRSYTRFYLLIYLLTHNTQASGLRNIYKLLLGPLEREVR